jgi:hypothetical protein
MNMVSSQNNEVKIVQGVSDTGINGTGGDVHGKIVTAKSPNTDHKHGNSTTNLNRSNNESNDAMYKPDNIPYDLSPHATLGSQLSITLESPHMAECGGNKNYGGNLVGLATPVVTVLKRSKRWEDSVDEDSSARVERLKAKRDLDGPGTLHSKSFLGFSDSKVEKNIETLGVSLGKNVASTIACLKEAEHNRLVQASSSEPRQLEPGNLHDEEVSDIDSGLGLDQYAIKHLIGDTAEDILGIEETQWSDFKSFLRKSKSGSSKKVEVKRR